MLKNIPNKILNIIINIATGLGLVAGTVGVVLLLAWIASKIFGVIIVFLLLLLFWSIGSDYRKDMGRKR